MESGTSQSRARSTARSRVSLTLKKGAIIPLKGHSPHAIAYLPRYGFLVVSDKTGSVHFYDLLQGGSHLSSFS